MKINLKFLTTAFLLSTALLLVGCNTSTGFKDWQKDNKTFQKVAENAR